MTLTQLDKRLSEYTAIFERAPEGGFTVTVPALEGCISEGDTFEEAEKNIREAILLYLEVAGEKRRISRMAGETFAAPVRI